MFEGRDLNCKSNFEGEREIAADGTVLRGSDGLYGFIQGKDTVKLAF